MIREHIDVNDLLKYLFPNGIKIKCSCGGDYNLEIEWNQYLIECKDCYNKIAKFVYNNFSDGVYYIQILNKEKIIIDWYNPKFNSKNEIYLYLDKNYILSLNNNSIMKKVFKQIFSLQDENSIIEKYNEYILFI